jgi:hypothetical protein
MPGTWMMWPWLAWNIWFEAMTHVGLPRPRVELKLVWDRDAKCAA